MTTPKRRAGPGRTPRPAGAERTVRLQLTLPERLAAWLRANVADGQRSAWIARAIEAELTRNRAASRAGDAPERDTPQQDA